MAPFLERLLEIQKWFEIQKIYRFYATSLIFVYEGDPLTEEEKCKVDLRMVDFAHSYIDPKGSQVDSNYMFGVQQVLSFFQTISQQYP